MKIHNKNKLQRTTRTSIFDSIFRMKIKHHLRNISFNDLIHVFVIIVVVVVVDYVQNVLPHAKIC